MGKLLKLVLERLNPGAKRVTAIVTDGEPSLMQLFQVKFTLN